MRGNTALKRGRLRQFGFLHLLAAAGIGYLLGGWTTTGLRSSGLSAAEAVSLRFPQHVDEAVPASPQFIASAAVADTTTDTTATDPAQLALLDPTPMVPQSPPLSSPPAAAVWAASPQPEALPRSQQTASAEDGASAVASVVAAAQATAPVAGPMAKPRIVAAPAARGIKPAAARRASEQRPGYLFNDAQIASIKARLHLTPSQEEMWPAVEAALRNMAYEHPREAARYGAPASATLTANIDPESVQGLKSAAVPLIMSFNSEQKDEVRNLVHVMGLDQLASEF